MKSGTVALIGRPNVGKSTLVNNLIGQKVAITSPKPQTTRFPIEALYEDDRGQIVFVDTPGIFNKAIDTLSKKINQQTIQGLGSEVDVVLYIVDPTRKRDFEEAKVLGIVRKIDKPKILVYNKEDEDRKYLPQYKFLESEFDTFFSISALKKNHLSPLLDKIFELLPTRGKIVDAKEYVYPALNMDSKTFLSELIREKVFLRLRRELPYTTTVVIDEIKERNDNLVYISAKIITTDNKYKKMIIGLEGRQIKVIGSMARKEIEAATNKKVYLELTVDVNRHWMETF